MDGAAGQLHLDVDAARLDAFEGHGDHPPRHSAKNPLLSQDLSTPDHSRRLGSRTNTEQSGILWHISDLASGFDTSWKLHGRAGSIRANSERDRAAHAHAPV